MTKFSINIPVLGSSETPPTPDTDYIAMYAKNDTDDKLYYIRSNGTEVALDASGGGGGAPDDATYIVQTANGTLTNEQALGALATGVLKSTTATGVVSIAAGSDLNTTHGSQTANHVYAAPDGSAGNPSFRAMVADDLPTLAEFQTLTDLTEYSSNAASITPFSSTPDGYNILHVLTAQRSDAANNFDDLQITVNANTTANAYNSVTAGFFDAAGTDTVFVTNDNSSGFFLVSTGATGATATTDFLGVLYLKIFNYTSTSQFKHVLASRLAIRDASSLVTYQVGQFGGIWEVTSKITEMEITPATGSNFTDGFYTAWVTK